MNFLRRIFRISPKVHRAYTNGFDTVVIVINVIDDQVWWVHFNPCEKVMTFSCPIDQFWDSFSPV